MPVATVAAVLLHMAGPCDAYPACLEAEPFGQPAIRSIELASVRGSGLPTVGVNPGDVTRRQLEAPVSMAAARPSDTLREITDNWNLQVGAELILAAMDQGSPVSNGNLRVQIAPITWSGRTP